ncbi:hypothetical protein [Azonexus sp.]|uniref:hypothetical protein n=1 Tax=Azonexus sp. TaxID=1872668 RepID=UPI0035B3D449
MDRKQVDQLSEFERSSADYKQAREIILAIEDLNKKAKELSSSPILKSVAGQLAAIDRQMERLSVV